MPTPPPGRRLPRAAWWIATAALFAIGFLTLPAGARSLYSGLAVASLGLGLLERRSGPRARSARWLAPLPLILVLAAGAWLYGPVLGGALMGDDPRLLRSAAEHGIAAHFLDPGAWRPLSGTFWTPWLVLSLGLDLALFGLEVGRFYAHQLLSLAAVVVLAYLLFRRLLPAWHSAIGLLFFLLLPPTASVVQQLMTRHYLEGLALLLASALALLKGVASRRSGWTWLGGLLGLAAMTAKEVFVPLAVLVPALPAALPLRQRAFVAVPYLLASVVYGVGRLLMLGPGHAFVAYGPLVESPVGGLPTSPATGLAPALPLAFAIVAVALALVVVARLLLRDLRRSFLLPLLAAAIVLPLLPVASALVPRYLFVPALFVSLAIALGLHQVARWRPLGGLDPMPDLVLVAPLIALATLTLSQSSSWRLRAEVPIYRQVEEAALRGDDSTTLLLTELGSPAYFRSLGWLRRHLLGLGPGPRVCADLCVCSHSGVERVLVTEGNRLEQRALAPLLRDLDCGDREAELRVGLIYRPTARGATMAWSLGPYTDGEYRFAGPSGEGEVSGHFRPLPPRGTIPFTLDGPFSFVISYRSAGGLRTDSPILTLDPERIDGSGEARLEWRRRRAPSSRPPP